VGVFPLKLGDLAISADLSENFGKKAAENVTWNQSLEVYMLVLR